MYSEPPPQLPETARYVAGPVHRAEIRARAMQALRREAAAAGRAEVDLLRARLTEKYSQLERARRERAEEARVLENAQCRDCVKMRVEAKLAGNPDYAALFCSKCRADGVPMVSKAARRVVQREERQKVERVEKLDRMLAVIDQYKQESGLLDRLTQVEDRPYSDLLERYREGGYDLDRILGPERGGPGEHTEDDAPSPAQEEGEEEEEVSASSFEFQQGQGRPRGPEQPGTSVPSTSSPSTHPAQGRKGASSPINPTGTPGRPPPSGTSSPSRKPPLPSPAPSSPSKTGATSATFPSNPPPPAAAPAKELEDPVWGRSPEEWMRLIETLSLDAIVEQADRAAALAPTPELRLRALQTAGQLRGLAVEIRNSRLRQERIRKLWRWKVRGKMEETDTLGRVDIRQRSERHVRARDAYFGGFSAAQDPQMGEEDEFLQILESRLREARTVAANLLSDAFRSKGAVTAAAARASAAVSPALLQTMGDPARSAKKSEERYLQRMEKAREGRVPVVAQPYFSLPAFDDPGETPYQGGFAQIDRVLATRPVGAPLPLPDREEEEFRATLTEGDIDRYMFNLLWEQGAIGEEHVEALQAALEDLEAEEARAYGLYALNARAAPPDLTTIAEESATVVAASDFETGSSRVERQGNDCSVGETLSSAAPSSSLTAPTASSASRAASAKPLRPTSAAPKPAPWGSKAAAAPRPQSAASSTATGTATPSSLSFAAVRRPSNVEPGKAAGGGEKREAPSRYERDASSRSLSLSFAGSEGTDRAPARPRAGGRGDYGRGSSSDDESERMVYRRDAKAAPAQAKGGTATRRRPPSNTDTVAGTTSTSSAPPAKKGSTTAGSDSTKTDLSSKMSGPGSASTSAARPRQASRTPLTGPPKALDRPLSALKEPKGTSTTGLSPALKEADTQTEGKGGAGSRGAKEFAPPPGWLEEVKRGVPEDLAKQVAKALRLGNKLL